MNIARCARYLLTASTIVALATFAGAGKATCAADVADPAWPTYGGTYDSARFVRLDRITPGSVHSLRLAWKYATGTYGQLETSPIVVGDTMYFSIGATNAGGALGGGRVVFVGEEEAEHCDAFDAESGALLCQSTLSDAVVTNDNPSVAIAQRFGNWVDRMRVRFVRKLSGIPVPESDQDVHAPPIAYAIGGRTYAAIAGDDLFGSGSDVGDTMYVFTLPNER